MAKPQKAESQPSDFAVGDRVQHVSLGWAGTVTDPGDSLHAMVRIDMQSHVSRAAKAELVKLA